MDKQSFDKKYNYRNATQVMKQYLEIKYAHLECLLLFRMGDFYELFYKDALIASRVLGIALTKRGKTEGEAIPMCGVPYHALENYLNKLLESGFKIAICEQVETPEEAKKRGGYKAVVERSVTRIITPGTIIEESLLEPGQPHYLASIVVDKKEAAIAFLDLSTSDFSVIRVPENELLNELVKINPKEILLAENYRSSELVHNINSMINRVISFQVNSFFAFRKSQKNILDFYKIHDLSAIGSMKNSEISAVGSILEYVCLTQKSSTTNLPMPKILSYYEYMSIDGATRKNLELVRSSSGSYKGSLLGAIDYTVTKGGKRLLYQYLSAPLLKIEAINKRLDITEFFFQNIELTNNIRENLAKTGDLERCVTRLNMGKSTPKDLLSIKYAIELAEQIIADFFTYRGVNFLPYIEEITSNITGLQRIYDIINESIKEDAPNILSEGNIIKLSYHPRIAQLYDLLQNTSATLNELKDKYRRETGIDSLKINSNNVIGMFIDITSKHAGKITNEKFIHRQTTANSIRYSTAELQTIESNILNAKSTARALEKEIYDNICLQIIDNLPLLVALSSSLNLLDVYCNLAYIAEKYNYTRPELTESQDLEIKLARHPVVEQALKKCNSDFVPNSCNLSLQNRIWLITGPNMGGKSTFLRQNAVIVILAQIGSFVPAQSAKIGIVDKIFSRIGAGDDLGKGQSTFMLEMLETSNILAQATSRSLVILDEVGRGTSTYDGVSIAWSVLEHIHDKIKSRCLFATHYHELTEMETILPALENHTVEVKENNNEILFLYKIKAGEADKSYGVHVAKLAGLPKTVIKRAEKLLLKFEKFSSRSTKEVNSGESYNMSLFDINECKNSRHIPEDIYTELKEINPDKLSPQDALNILYSIKEKLIKLD